MTNTLRPIAVLVQEPRPGRFHWMLTERGSGDTWTEIQRSPAPAATYRQAMADGLLALQALVEDLDIGPRRADPAPPVRQPAVRHAPQAPGDPAMEQSAPAKRSLFGFGPAK